MSSVASRSFIPRGPAPPGRVHTEPRRHGDATPVWGNERAYGIAGLAAAIVAGAQIAGGLLVPHLGRLFCRRTSVLLSFDALMGSSGAVVIQPILGRAADAWSYPVSYLCSAAIQALALPFIWLARRQ